MNLGAVDPCNPCVKLNESDIQLRSDLGWIENSALLGADLSQSLRSIRDNRLAGKQFYVSKVSGVGNPSFDHELGYANLTLPDAGFQLLGLYRFWNIIEYWSPYRDLAAEDWNGVLAEFIPRIAEAKNAESYRQEVLALITEARDGHANLWSALDARPPVGKCQLRVNVRFVDQLPVISGFPPADSSNPTELRIGDVITELDGVSVGKLVESWRPYYAASNDAGRLRDIGSSITRGQCGESTITIRRESRELTLKINRVSPGGSDSGIITHDLPGPAFRLLSKDVAYLKLSSVKSADAASYVEQAAGTKGLIVDIRNYPSDFMLHWGWLRSIAQLHEGNCACLCGRLCGRRQQTKSCCRCCHRCRWSNGRWRQRRMTRPGPHSASQSSAPDSRQHRRNISVGCIRPCV